MARRDKAMIGEPEHVRRNRLGWNASSAEYEQQHAKQLESTRTSWGTWSIPESEVRALGEVRDKDVLELGCGAARWSLGLANLGARCVGMDLSDAQLAHAQRLIGDSEQAVPLVQASAERLPFDGSSFDLVFCDHGAMSFADPFSVVPEVARVLRPGGSFVFNAMSHIHNICYDAATDQTSSTPQLNYFDTFRMEWDDEVNFTLPYGHWIRLFRANGLTIEDLIELRPPQGATTTYDMTVDWANRLPGESIWRLQRAGV